jgi:hypothetical protein
MSTLAINSSLYFTPPWEASHSLSLLNITNNFSLGQILPSQASHPPWPIKEEAANSLSLYKKALAGYPSTFGSHF